MSLARNDLRFDDLKRLKVIVATAEQTVPLSEVKEPGELYRGVKALKISPYTNLLLGHQVYVVE